MAKNETNKPLGNDGAPTADHLEKAPTGAGADDLQKRVDEAEEKGYIGEKVDPRPNSDYSQIGGMPGVK